MFRTTLLCLALWGTTGIATSNDAPNPVSNTSFDQGIIPNKGQLLDQHHAPVDEVLYYYHGNGLSAYFQHNTISFVKEQHTIVTEERDGVDAHGRPAEEAIIHYSKHRFDVELLGAASRPTITTQHPTAFQLNYYNANVPKGVSVRGYQSITYHNIYPNIDLVYRHNEKGLKYDFVIHPGGNVNDIQLKYTGADGVAIIDNQLQVSTQLGIVSEEAPYSYLSENQRIINTQLQQKDDVISFHVASYDRTQTLVIDPQLVWSTFYGNDNGTYDETFNCIIRDQANNLYVGGSAGANNFPTVDPGGSYFFQGAYGGFGDATILKFDANDAIVWATYFGGAKSDVALGIKINPANNELFVCGTTRSPDFPLQDPGGMAYFDDTHNGTGVNPEADAFMLKFNTAGALLWSTFLGGDNPDELTDIHFEPSGNVIVTGNTKSANMPTYNRFGAYNSFNYQGGWQGYITQFDPNTCQMIWGTIYSQTVSGGFGSALNVSDMDSNGNLYLSGWSDSPNWNLFNPGAGYYSNTHSNRMATIVKFNAAGQRVWATFFGGSNQDHAYGLAVQDNGTLFIYGTTESPDIPLVDPGNCAYFDDTQNNYDCFIAKFDPGLNLVWSTYYGGNADDRFPVIATNESGFYAMMTTYDVGLTPFNPGGTYFDPTYNGGFSDYYLSRFTDEGQLEWSTFYGGTELDLGRNHQALITNNNGDFTICGATNSFNGFPTLNPGGGAYFDNSIATVGNDYDGFISSFINTIQLLFLGNDTTVCAGETIVLDAGPNYDAYLWSDGSTNQTLTVTTPGTYWVNAYDIFGCFKSDTINIDHFPDFTVTPTLTHPLCNGNNNGQIALAIAGGNSPYTYAWSSGGNGSTETGLAAGTYDVTITDANNCSKTFSYTLIDPAPFSINASSTDANCGNPDGTVSVTVVGGVSPFTYQWVDAGNNPVGNTPSVNGLVPGTYTITVTDANNCPQTATVIVNGVGSINVVVLSSSNPSCFGSTDGSATVAVIGGTPPFTYLWSNGNTNATANNLGAGTHDVEVTDANGCVSFATVTLTEPAALTATFNAVVPTCPGGNDGTITATVNGGTSPYTYAWSSGGNGSTETGLIAGFYSVTITDANGCSITENIPLSDPLGLSITTSTVPTSCGNPDGEVSVTATGGNTPYTYVWEDTGNNVVGNTATVTGLTSGTYTITVTDANGCVQTATVVINNIGAGTASITSSSNPLCFGSTDGSATVTIVGGTSPYTYLWPNGNTNATANDLGAGIHTVLVTDALGCVVSATVTLTEPAALTATLSAVSPNCFGGNDGTATATASGGTTPYTYLWSTGANTATASNLLANVNYSVTITDANGCSITENITLTEPQGINISVASIFGSCGNPNGEASATVTGGTSPYTYVWEDAGNNVVGNAATVTGLASGIYTVTVTDANGCIQTAIAIVGNNTTGTVSITSSSNPLCFGSTDGSATVTIVGGTPPFTYLWSNGNTNATANDLGAGTHTVTVTDFNGCATSTTVTLTEPTVLTATLSAVDPNCAGGNDGTATATVNGGTTPYTYLWSTGAITATASNLSANVNHSVTITDGNGCSITESITLTEPPALSITSTTTPPNCSNGCDGNGTVNVTGGTSPYTYQWDANAGNQTTATANNLCAGSFDCVITDANGCTQTISVTVINPTPLSIATLDIDDVRCNGACDGAADVIAVGGAFPYTYTWSPAPGNGQGTPNASQLCAGNYTVTVTDANNCSIDTPFIVAEPAPIAPTVNITPVSCNGLCDGVIDLSVAGGTSPYSYDWSNGTTGEDISGVCADLYTVVITDDHGCTEVLASTMSEPLPLILTASNDTTICDGGTAVLLAEATGGTSPYTYNWNNGLIGTGPHQVNPTQNTCYDVQVVDANNCSSNMVTSCVTVLPPISVNIASTATTICEGEEITLTANANGGNGNYTITWNNGLGTGNTVTTIPNTYPAPITYTATVSDGCSIDATASISIFFHPNPEIQLTVNDNDGCAPFMVQFSNFPNNSAQCLIDMGDGNTVEDCNPFDYIYEVPGTYTINYTATSSEGCVTQQTFTDFITVYENPVADFTIDENPISIQDPNATFTDQSYHDITDWWWTFYPPSGTNALGNSSATNPSFEFPPNSGVYPVHLMVTDINGCVDDTLYYINIEDDFIVYTPNAFTPDGDGINDFFAPVLNGIDPSTYQLYIYNRWGQLIFESNDPGLAWGGTQKGVPVQQDVYVWKLVFAEATNKTKTHDLVGHVTLIR